MAFYVQQNEAQNLDHQLHDCELIHAVGDLDLSFILYYIGHNLTQLKHDMHYNWGECERAPHQWL